MAALCRMLSDAREIAGGYYYGEASKGESEREREKETSAVNPLFDK